MSRPKKSLGQNFLIDPLVIDRTIQYLNPLPSDNLLKFSPTDVSEEKIRVVGNLPYNLSTSILLWSFGYLNLFLDMHFMFQKEFGERLIAKNNTKNFGRTSVITQYLTKPQYCFSIEFFVLPLFLVSLSSLLSYLILLGVSIKIDMSRSFLMFLK